MRTIERFYRHNFAPWGSTYSINVEVSGYAALNIRTGDASHTIDLGSGRATMLALAAALTRAAATLPERGGGGIEWQVVDGHEIEVDLDDLIDDADDIDDVDVGGR